MIYVTDTHAFLWFLTEDKRLGKKAKEIFLAADKGDVIVIVPTITLIEALHICEKHRVDAKFSEVLEKIKNSLNYIVYPLNLKVVEKCEELKQLVELHDRVMVAITQILNTKLITKDRNIRESTAVECIW